MFYLSLFFKKKFQSFAIVLDILFNKTLKNGVEGTIFHSQVLKQYFNDKKKLNLTTIKFIIKKN